MQISKFSTAGGKCKRGIPKLQQVNPFTLNLGKDRRSITVDLNRLLPPNTCAEEAAKALGDLRVGILHESLDCVEIITEESIDYLRNDGLYTRVPVQYDISESQFHVLLEDNPLVIVRLGGENDGIFNDKKICGENIIQAGKHESADVLVKEELSQAGTIECPPDDRCNSQLLSFNEDPGKDIPYYDSILTSPHLSRFGLTSSSRVDEVPEGVKFLKKDPKHPLFGFGSHESLQALLIDEPVCNISNLRTSLQTAIELEWGLLPLYLTSWFTIKSLSNGGCIPNSDNYGACERIYSIVIQEMLHMAQAANLLTAVGGKPVINASTEVNYPRKGLPGGVLKNLQLSIEKLTLDQARCQFMAVEIPRNSSAVYPPIINDLYTIGAFYRHIFSCIDFLGEEIFNDPGNQIQHDFGSHGTLYVVKDLKTANVSINEIIDQGEGTSPLDPNQADTEGVYAHFYKFEEITCQNALKKVGTNHYAYSGEELPFVSSGIYNMIANPSGDTIPPGTACYNATKDFNDLYKSIVENLDTGFANGDQGAVSTAIGDMFALPGKAQTVMQLPLQPGSPLACGPVWDLDF